MKLKGEYYNMWDVWWLKNNDEFHGFHLKSHWGENWNVGHIITKDLLHYRRVTDILPTLSEEDYPDDCMGKYTGCAITGKDGIHYIYYTMRDKYGSQKIGLTTSTDLKNFELYENNPVLELDESIFLVKEKGLQTNCRDMFVIYKEDEELYYGFFAAMTKEDGLGEKSVVGVAKSKDLYTWYDQKIAYEATFNGVVEMPEVFCFEGMWYMIMLTGNGYGSINAVKDKNLCRATIYAVSNNIDGPFVENDDNVFLGGKSNSGYSCRTVIMGGKRYVLYVDPGCEKAALSLPKEVKVVNGNLRPYYTEILKSIRTNKEVKNVNSMNFKQKNSSRCWNTVGGKMTVCDDGVVIETSKRGWHYATINDFVWNSLEVECTLEFDAVEAGIVLEASEDKPDAENYFVYFNSEDGDISILYRNEEILARRKFQFKNNTQYNIRLIIQESVFEIYIDDVLVMQGGIRIFDDISVGFACVGGTAKFTNIALYELEK